MPKREKGRPDTIPAGSKAETLFRMMWLNGDLIEKIAKTLGVSIRTVKYRRKLLGLQPRRWR